MNVKREAFIEFQRPKFLRDQMSGPNVRLMLGRKKLSDADIGTIKKFNRYNFWIPPMHNSWILSILFDLNVLKRLKSTIPLSIIQFDENLLPFGNSTKCPRLKRFVQNIPESASVHPTIKFQ